MYHWVSGALLFAFWRKVKGILRALALFRGDLRVTGERVKGGFMLPEVFKRSPRPFDWKGRGRWRATSYGKRACARYAPASRPRS